MKLGIEIGGTKLQLGVGRGDGSRPVEIARHDVRIADGAPGILAQIQQAASRLIAAHAVTSIGIGFGGPVDPQTRCVVTSHQVPGWDNFPLEDWCESRLGLPTRVGNDCDCAALAEALDGAGQGRACVFFVTVGTGIGGGLVIGGTPCGTGRPAVAEIGHLRPGPSCVDAAATVESWSSGPGLAATARRRIAELLSGADPAARASVAEMAAAIGDGGRISGPGDAGVDDGGLRQFTAKELAAAAARGNPLAMGLLDDGLRVLGWAIAQVITIIAPHVVVVGGGVSLIGETLFYQPLRRHVATYVFPPLADTYEILPPRFGETVVVQGALRLAP